MTNKQKKMEHSNKQIKSIIDDPDIPTAHGIINNKQDVETKINQIQNEISEWNEKRRHTIMEHVPKHNAISQLTSSSSSSLLPSSMSTQQYGHQHQHQHKHQYDDTRVRDYKHMRPIQKRAMERRKKKNKFNQRHEEKMAQLELRQMEHAMATADAELILQTEESGLLEPENDMEKTRKVTQKELKYKYLSENNAKQIFDLTLEQYGPYGMSYDRSGKCGLLYGKRGHVSILNCQQLSLNCEMNVNEIVRDATFLHNDSMFALAQKKHVYIYDDTGAEIHHMEGHQDPFALQFLPYHWLLASIGRAGYLTYTDTSTGQFISKHRTRLGPCSVMKQNPQNAVLHLGHGNGIVTLYSPAQSESLIKINAHYGGPIRDLAIDPTGKYMVTAGADSKLKVWDLRTWKHLHTYTCYFAPPSTIDISQRGILGVGHGVHNTFWSSDMYTTKVKEPYMTHTTSSIVETLRFRPFEDVCGIGHINGYSSIVIPGSGEPNLDSMEYNTNPYQDKKQRREAVVKSLLDKLSPDMIALDPDVIGTIESDLQARQAEYNEKVEEANQKKQDAKRNKIKHKMRGKNKIGKKIKRKQQNVIDANVEKWKQSLKEQTKDKKRKNDEMDDTIQTNDAPSALKRFFS